MAGKQQVVERNVRKEEGKRPGELYRQWRRKGVGRVNEKRE